ncbi:translation initiation factor IF-2 [Patescibacteria group bacterium]|nr:translation initiation factor IF-2 [Patescibacteria group bacterium]
MGIKISDLAKKLGMEVKLLRQKVQELHLGVSKKANVFKDELAVEIERRLSDKDSKQNETPKEVIEAKVELVSDEEDKTVKKEDEKEPVDLPKIEIPKMITVGELASNMDIGVSEVIKELMKNGVLANINEHIDFDTAAIIGEDLGYEVVLCEQEGDSEECLIDKEEYAQKDLVKRAPIVTVMGHVDHGKTSILDKIRKSDIALSESGGITQHIGAYKVKRGKKYITFLDTPGHKAFSAMRAHGAKLTDIAVLVVAADDGVKPQTIEAINHARAASVPIIVALNKIDRPEANVDKVKKELADYNLMSEEWGGNTIIVETSAKTGAGIDELLEMILLLADMEDLKAYKDGPAQGVVIEAHLSKRVGPVATVMITQGCLRVRDSIVIGITDGVVRAMVDHRGERLTKAYPADPVRLAGLSEVPEFGDTLLKVANSKEAKTLVASRKKKISSKGFKPKSIGMAELSQAVREGKIRELPVILKADVQGSLEAIKSSLDNIKNEEVKVNILHEAPGSVNESDVMMAASSHALILAFRSKIEPNALKIAKKLGVNISTYDVVYRLLDDVTAALEGLLQPEVMDVKIGKGRLLRIFTRGRKYRIVGVGVISGYVEKGAKAVVYRENEKVGEGVVEGVKKGNENVAKVQEKNECGMGLTGDFKVEEGDVLEFWQQETKMRKLSRD